MIYQGLRPQRVINFLQEHDCPRKTWAALMGLSETMVSLHLSCAKGLSYDSQERGFMVIRFMEQIAEESTAPVDFRQTERIVELFEAWQRKYQEAEVIQLGRDLESKEQGLADEIRAREQVKS